MSEHPATAHGETLSSGPPSVDIRHGVKALIESETAVLLVKERHRTGEPFWTLPGGGLCQDEAARTGLRRELHEELRCPIAIGQALGRWCYAHRPPRRALSVYQVFRASVLAAPTHNHAEGVVATRWVSPDALPARTLPQVRRLIRSRW